MIKRWDVNQQMRIRKSSAVSASNNETLPNTNDYENDSPAAFDTSFRVKNTNKKHSSTLSITSSVAAFVIEAVLKKLTCENNEETLKVSPFIRPVKLFSFFFSFSNNNNLNSSLIQIELHFNFLKKFILTRMESAKNGSNCSNGSFLI
jgi:hypothetical protein